MDLIAPSLNIQTGANAAHDTMNDSIVDGKISSGFFDRVVSGEKIGELQMPSPARFEVAFVNLACCG